MAEPVPFPFFVGVGRSGTTLLRSVFNAHSELAVAHEPRFAAWMARNQARYVRDGEFRVGRFLDDLLVNPRVPSRLSEYEFDAGVVRSRVTEAHPGSLADAVRCVYGLYAELQGKPRCGDKTPGYVQHLPELAELLPEGRFVHIVRDGRDVALALREVEFGATTLAQAAYQWAHRIRRAERAGRSLGASRYLLVRYEDLTRDPQTVSERICGFLGLRFEPDMLCYFQRPKEVFGGLGAQRHHENLRRPITAGLRDWRQDMLAADVRRYEAIAGDVLSALGYELRSDGRGLGVSDRVRTGLELALGKARSAASAKRRTGHRQLARE